LIISSFYPDTIDLQDREAPSAKDHLRAPVPTSHGSLAPHQAETIREVAAETAQENLRSPGVLWTGGEVGDLHQYADQLAAGVDNSLHGRPGASDGATTSMHAIQTRDALAIAQNGGVSVVDVDDGDLSGDGDDSMDDDMMDKISSSPSIEDGASPSSIAALWSPKTTSLHLQPFLLPTTISDARSHAPYLEHHDSPDLSLSRAWKGKVFPNSARCHHHHPAGEYNLQDRPASNGESTLSILDTP
jgi:hypothetical protein